jgi:type II secretory pathway pseudopilin PulG
MHRPRFTLIDLVIVIGVLVLLMGMLVPSCGHRGSREKARRINCAGNLKQIGLALLMYSGEFDGYFPNNTANGTNFNLLNKNGHLSNGKVYGCPSQTDLRTTANVSNYRYIGSGRGFPISC